MRITSKGQVTIPAKIREKLGLLENTEVEFEIVGDAVRVRKARGRRARGQSVVSRLRGRATRRMSTDQILALTQVPASVVGEHWQHQVRALVVAAKIDRHSTQIKIGTRTDRTQKMADKIASVREKMENESH